MKRLIKLLSIIFIFSMLCGPTIARAEEDEAIVKVDSFVINSVEDEVYNATMKVIVDTAVVDKINYHYSVAIVTDISQEGTQLTSGNAQTGEEITFDIDMSKINTYSNYRFKILIEYDDNGQKGFTYGYTQVFEYTQESYSDDLEGRDITVDVSGMTVDVSWENFKGRGQSVLVTIEVDGIVDFEELVPMSEGHYKYFFDKDAKVITVTLKRAVDGLLSKGTTDTINIADKTPEEFYLEFPSPMDQYDSVWNVKYYNAKEQSVKWYTDDKEQELTLENSGSFIIDIDEDNEKLSVEYLDIRNVKWIYSFATDLASYAPNITLLEAYDGSKVTSSNLVMAGMVDDASSQVLVNGEKVTLNKDGSFLADVKLTNGKNTIEITATNSIGKTSRATVTIYKEAGGTIVDQTSSIGKFLPLIITVSASIILSIVMIILLKKGSKKNGTNATTTNSTTANATAANATTTNGTTANATATSDTTEGTK